MEITALIVLCIIAALLALSLRGQRPEFAMLLSLGCGLFVLLYLLGQMKDIFSGLEDILSGLSGQSELTAIILKALGVCIVAELGSQCCRDAGETAIAFFPQEAIPAAMETRFCSAIPTSTNCSGYCSAKGVMEPLPLESEHNTTISLSSDAFRKSTLQIACLFAVFMTFRLSMLFLCTYIVPLFLQFPDCLFILFL